MQRPILIKIMLSAMVSMLLLITFGAITFAWIGIATYSRIENFDISLESQILEDYGLEISLTGKTGSFTSSVNQTELKKHILINYYNDPIRTQEINTYSNSRINSEFNSLVLDQATIEYNSTKNWFYNDDKTDFSFLAMNDKDNNYIVEVPTTSIFKFDLYISIYKIEDDGSSKDGLEPDYDPLIDIKDANRVEAYLKGDIFRGNKNRVGTIFDYTYPNNYLSGYSNIPTNVIPGGTKITGIKTVDSSSAARLMFAKRGVVKKGNIGLTEIANNPSKNQINSYQIYETGSKLPTVKDDVYSFGTILKDEANFAVQNFNLKHQNPAMQKSVPASVLTRGNTDILYDSAMDDEDAHVVNSLNPDEEVGIRHMLKMTIYFWFEGWDSDCFDVIDRSPVSININLALSRASA